MLQITRSNFAIFKLICNMVSNSGGYSVLSYWSCFPWRVICSIGFIFIRNTSALTLATCIMFTLQSGTGNTVSRAGFYFLQSWEDLFQPYWYVGYIQFAITCFNKYVVISCLFIALK